MDEIQGKVIQNLSERAQDNISDDEPIIIKEVTRVHKFAGRLCLFIERWRSITSDKYILSCLSGYRIPFVETPVQKIPPKEKILYEEETEKIQLEINELLRKGAIEECRECKGQFLSSYFLVPKPDGTNRFIFNLKKLNEFINHTLK